MNTDSDLKQALEPHILDRLRNYKGVSKLRKEAMNVLVKMLDQNKIQNLRAAFHDMDKDQTGMITLSEL